jgi:hypothetical protein
MIESPSSGFEISGRDGDRAAAGIEPVAMMYMRLIHDGKLEKVIGVCDSNGTLTVLTRDFVIGRKYLQLAIKSPAHSLKAMPPRHVTKYLT